MAGLGYASIAPERSNWSDCSQACYRCIQKYGNRGYHGLLDWRLGLGFLRALINGSYASGLDGNFSFPELIDWRERVARRCADEIALLKPGSAEVRLAGKLSLPFVKMASDQGPINYLMLHPFWRINARERAKDALGSAIAEMGPGKLRFIDTFDATRRPVNAWEKSASRPDDP